MDTIKDTNRMYLTEAEDIKKKWQENTKLSKENFNDLDGVITHSQTS